jgi:hypothetical protein
VKEELVKSMKNEERKLPFILIWQLQVELIYGNYRKTFLTACVLDVKIEDPQRYAAVGSRL